MMISRDRSNFRRILTGLAAITFVVAAPGLGFGQPVSDVDEVEDSEASGAPMGLLRPSRDDGDRATDSDPAEPSVRALPTPPGTTASVDVGILGKMTDQSIGILGIQEGGFGEDMWAGSRRLVVESLYRDIPSSSKSAVVQDLRRRLLISRAVDPAGMTSGESILALRVDRLYGAGLATEALEIARQGQAIAETGFGDEQDSADLDPAVMKVSAQIYLLHDDIRQACTQAIRVRSLSDEAFWSKLRAVCYAIAGDPEKASFTATLLREEDHQDAAFYGLLGRATDSGSFDLGEMNQGSALHWSLLKLIGEALPANALEGSDLSVLARIAETGIAGGRAADLLSLRLPAAESAAMYGAYSVDSLRTLYRTVIVADGFETVPTPNVDVSQLTSEHRAKVFQAAENTSDSINRANLIAQALSEADNMGLRSLTVAVYGPMVAVLPADVALQSYAEDFLSVLIANGNYQSAARWFSLLERFDLTERRAGRVGAQQAVARFRTLLALSHPFEDQTHRDWRSVSRLSEAVSSEDYTNAVLEVRLLDALRLFVPEEARVLMLERPADPNGHMPASGILSGLDAAARAGRQAETVLYGLVALGDAGPVGAHPSVVANVVAGLRRVGLKEDAKKLAIESLLSNS